MRRDSYGLVMTREQIEKAAIKKLPYSDEECSDSNYTLGKNVGFKRGFIAGALWRINSVWHSTKELPRRSGFLAVLMDNGLMETMYFSVGIGFHENQLMGYVLWAYVDDLLPERKEKEQ